MNERQKRLFDLFKTAIEAERAAQEMYSQLMGAAGDDELRAVIDRFRREEEQHEQFLLDRYAEMRLSFSG